MMKEILEKNKYWTLSKEDKVLSFVSSTSSNRLTFMTKNGFFDKNNSSDFIEYSWMARNTGEYLLYENGESLKFQYKKIIIIRKSCYILYAEKDTTVYNTTANIFKINEYDYNLTPKGHYLGILDNDTYHYVKICDLNKTSYYYTYHFNNISRIIFHEGSDVKIVTLNNKGLIEQYLVINNVETFYRLTRKHGNVNYLFSFFVLRTKKGQIVLNIKSLLYIDIQSKNLLPTSFSVNERDYLKKCERFVIKQEQEFLCIDNAVYDVQLKKVVSITTKWDSNPVILDTYDNYIAVSDCRNEIHILKWNPTLKAKVEELHYICRSDSKQRLICLIIEDMSKTNAFATFDPMKKEFVVNIDSIKYTYDRKKTFDCFANDNYGIMDALDGDPDAYWNID